MREPARTAYSAARIGVVIESDFVYDLGEQILKFKRLQERLNHK